MIDVNGYVKTAGPCTILPEADRSKAQLVRDAEALTTLDSVEYYLYGTSYEGRAQRVGDFAEWFESTGAAVQLVRRAQREVRENIARLIGAKLY